jgi:alanyl-tRNA synthetase
MKSSEIRQRYLKFFEKRGHKIIPSASLVPENDPSSLFITAGMQPLVPYLLGAKHPAGTRLVDIQKCIRTGDIDDVGDNRHLTFFEMMGNWSLGDYFKKEAIEWSLDFLTSKEEGLGLDPKRLYVTVFKGEDGIPRDEESIALWKENFSKHSIKTEVSGTDEMVDENHRIIPLGKDDNFWIAGQTGPCGGDTEMFYDVRPEEGKLSGKFADLVKSGRIIEIWNNVFMEFNKTSDEKYLPLAKKNVDTGMGLERTTVVMQEKANVFETDIFETILSEIKRISLSYDEKSARIIADHIRAATFIISDGVAPSNSEAGYVLRRILRRAITQADKIGLTQGKESGLSDISNISRFFINQNMGIYPNLTKEANKILNEIEMEEKKFRISLNVTKTPHFMTAIKKLANIEIHNNGMKESSLNVDDIFNFYQTNGIPISIIFDELNNVRKNYKMGPIPSDIEKHIMSLLDEKIKKHKEISKAGSEQKFKGGLAGTGEMETKYHTATHLLLAALRTVLKGEIVQKGSNITAERMRFDFNWPEKVPADKLKEVENLVNQKITEKLPVEIKEMPKEEAKKVVTTLSFDLSKYGDIVKVYKIGDFSTEFCGGPHVKNIGELGHFKIVKEEASSAGVRRIKAVLE